MASTKSTGLCAQASRNLDKLYDERNRQQFEVSRLEEQVALRQGEIAVAENTLSSILDAASNVSDAAVSLGVDIVTGDTPGAVRDGIALAARLATEEARQRQELANLHRQLENEKWELQAARNALDVIERDVQQTVNFLDANDCR